MSKIFVPNRGIGYVSNQIPLQVRYIKSRKENLIVTCVGRSFHTYGVSHFGLLSVSGLHPSEISCMTSDAYHIYTACENVIYVWRRGTELKHTFRGHRKSIHLMLPFGPHLISVDESSNIRVWDIKGQCQSLEFTFSNETFQITAILHPSTYINKILLGSHQGQLQLWNMNSTKLIYTFEGWDAGVTCLEQAPALDVVAIGLHNGRIMLHNLKYNESIMEFTQDWGLVTCISFRSDGHPIMASGSTTGHIVFWDLEERKIASQTMNAHCDSVTGMKCLPNEPLIVTSSPDNTLKLWIFDMTDGGARLLRLREGHSSPPTCIRYHGANGHNILSSAGDSTLRIFNTQTEQFNKSLGKASYNRKASKKRGRMVEDPLIMPPIVQFTSETTREKEWDNIACLHLGIPMVTTWSYHKLKMGDLKLLPERLYKKNKSPNDDSMATCLCLTYCGNFVVIGYSSGHVDRFNIQSGIWRDYYGNPKAHENASIRGVACDVLNQIVITGASDGLVKFWKFKSKGQTAALTTLDMEESVQFFRLHSEGSMLAVALEDFSLKIIDTDTRIVTRQFHGHSAQITDATFSPNARWLITSGMDCVLRTWDIPSAQLVDQFRTETACISLDVSPTGEALITAHVDYLGIFMWCNRTLYQCVTLRAQDIDQEAPLVELPEIQAEEGVEDIEEDALENEFKSPEQISQELVTMSGLATSRWQNLLQIDLIRQKNKPKMPPKAPKSAPFFLPTIPALDLQFDTSDAVNNSAKPNSKIVSVNNFENMTEFGKTLLNASVDQERECVVKILKNMGPTMIDFEMKCLAPEEGGSVQVLLQFFKLIEWMLRSNRDFDLAQSYLSVFLKHHGEAIANEKQLCNYLPNVESCLQVSWGRLQEQLMYCLCVVQHVKTQI